MMGKYVDACQHKWRPLIEKDGLATVVGFFQVAHGTGPSYEVIYIVSFPDWKAWGELRERDAKDSGLRQWGKEAWNYQRQAVSKLMLPAPWSPLDGKLTAPSADARNIYLHDTAWPLPGKLEEYLEALKRDWVPYTEVRGLNKIVGCWYVSPGGGRANEVVILQQIPGWEAWAKIRSGGQDPRAGEWVHKGWAYRHEWESKILQPVPWSPLQ
jgi:hypothetical protein